MPTLNATVSPAPSTTVRHHSCSVNTVVGMTPGVGEGWSRRQESFPELQASPASHEPGVDHLCSAVPTLVLPLAMAKGLHVRAEEAVGEADSQILLLDGSCLVTDGSILSSYSPKPEQFSVFLQGRISTFVQWNIIQQRKRSDRQVQTSTRTNLTTIMKREMTSHIERLNDIL